MSPADRELNIPSAPFASSPVHDEVISRAVARRFALAAIMAALLAGAGIVLKHSPVPDNDMWDGCIAFFLDISHGAYGAWFLPHHEHVIFFSRLLYWLDLSYLGGYLWAPALANFGAMLAGWSIMSWVARKLVFDGASCPEEIFVASLLALLLFSYVQAGNVWSSFNIHFFLACVFPLSAFICFSLSISSRSAPSSRSWFGASLGLGVASVGTMASGILVLPLLAGAALVSRQPRARVLLLASTGVLCAGGYLLALKRFGGYANGSDFPSGAPLRAFDAVAFVPVFVGSAVGRILHSTYGAGIAGVFVIAIGLKSFGRYAAARDRRPLTLAMCTLIAYVVLCGAMAASRRVPYGIEQAMTERYTTFSLYGIGAALILALAARAPGSRLGKKFLAGASMIAVVLLIVQTRALGDRALERHRLDVAALALTLPNNASTVDELLYPRPERLLQLSEQARLAKISIFAQPRFRNVAAHLGRDRHQLTLQQCPATYSLHALGEGKPYVAVRGQPDDRLLGSFRVWFVSESDKIVGVALPGRPLPDDHDGWWVRESAEGFDGFVLADARAFTTWCDRL